MSRIQHSFIAMVVIGTVAALANQAWATVITSVDKNDTGFTLSSDELGQSATVTYTGTIQRGNAAKLNDGSLGAGMGGGADGGGDDANTVFSDASITYTFDTTGSHSAGYDIARIETYAGWSTSMGGRSNQGYRVDLTFVDDSSATLIAKGHFQPNTPSDPGNLDTASYWTQVVHTNEGGGALNNGSGVVATGVKAVTFTEFDISSCIYGGPVMYREFDVFTVPEPGTFLLLATGLIGLLAYAWQKRR